jgi:hypothetical protein
VGRSGTAQGWMCVTVWGATQSVTHGSGSDVRRLIQRQEQQAAVLSANAGIAIDGGIDTPTSRRPPSRRRGGPPVLTSENQECANP